MFRKLLFTPVLKRNCEQILRLKIFFPPQQILLKIAEVKTLFSSPYLCCNLLAWNLFPIESWDDLFCPNDFLKIFCGRMCEKILITITQIYYYYLAVYFTNQHNDLLGPNVQNVARTYQKKYIYVTKKSISGIKLKFLHNIFKFGHTHSEFGSFLRCAASSRRLK